VGERPRWRAIAPYLGIPAATAAVFVIEAFAPTVAALVWSACSRSNYYRECCTWCRVRSAGTEGTWVGEEFAMGNHGRGPVNARRIDGCGIDRDQEAIYVSATRQLRIQTEAADILGRESILITGTKTKIPVKFGGYSIEPFGAPI